MVERLIGWRNGRVHTHTFCSFVSASFAFFFSRASVSFCIWQMSDKVVHKQTGNCSRFLTPFARSMHAQEFDKARVDQIASDRQRISRYIRTEKSDSHLWPATRAWLAVFVSCLCTCAVWGVGWKIFRNILHTDLLCRHATSLLEYFVAILMRAYLLNFLEVANKNTAVSRCPCIDEAVKITVTLSTTHACCPHMLLTSLCCFPEKHDGIGNLPEKTLHDKIFIQYGYSLIFETFIVRK